MQKQTPKTKEEARQQAIQFQHWQATESLSYTEILEWQAYFSDVALKYDLTEEFTNNGII